MKTRDNQASFKQKVENRTENCKNKVDNKVENRTENCKKSK